ncbi:hypothetical protein AB1Y20_001512 [Prymnesium parvum]|uniref:Uncharacterized protein n=1 Tax=Prymnesium parvum TaxID=97485 RepID=A0AB34KBL5_PRYPA
MLPSWLQHLLTCCDAGPPGPAHSTSDPRSWFNRPRTLVYMSMGPSVPEEERARVVRSQIEFRKLRILVSDLDDSRCSDCFVGKG